jgi:hypothetical protein
MDFGLNDLVTRWQVDSTFYTAHLAGPVHDDLVDADIEGVYRSCATVVVVDDDCVHGLFARHALRAGEISRAYLWLGVAMGRNHALVVYRGYIRDAIRLVAPLPCCTTPSTSSKRSSRSNCR